MKRNLDGFILAINGVALFIGVPLCILILPFLAGLSGSAMRVTATTGVIVGLVLALEYQVVYAIYLRKVKWFLGRLEDGGDVDENEFLIMCRRVYNLPVICAIHMFLHFVVGVSVVAVVVHIVAGVSWSALAIGIAEGVVVGGMVGILGYLMGVRILSSPLSFLVEKGMDVYSCLLYTSPSPRD